jgi:predicted nucleic acid-binding Zn ribbon protein
MRLIDSWREVVGEVVANYTDNLYIRNQTLFVHLTNPALRSDLSMMRREIVNKLNTHVGSQVIVDIRFN